MTTDIEPTEELKYGCKVGVGRLAEIYIGERMRKEIEDKENTLDELYDSIQGEHGKGLIQAIAVEELPEEHEHRAAGYKWALLAGGRRTSALIKNNYKGELPLRIYPPLADDEREDIEILENIRRKNFTWDEEVKAKKRLHDNMIARHGQRATSSADGWSIPKTAALTGTSRSQTHRDMVVAAALEAVPELANLKSKDDVLKFIKKAGKDFDTKQRVAEIEARRADQSEDAWLLELENSFHVSDVFEGLAKLPDRSVNMIEIDPPYAIAEFAPRFLEEGPAGIHFQDWTAETYVQNLRAVAAECYRILEEDSWLLCWFAQHPWGPITFDCFIEAGFQGMRMPGIWVKQASVHATMNLDCYLGRNHEAFYYLRKGQPKIQAPGRPDCFHFDADLGDAKTHATQKPLTLYHELLRVFGRPGDNILVPFLGSGNVILAAHNMKMSAFGFDNSQQHKDNYIVRLHEKEWML